MLDKNNKIIVILGTTASGKTKLGVDLARQFNGEIISADSRQVYRGLDVGSGKDLIEYGEIKYHLIDVADPKERFSVAEYQRQAFAAIEDILSRGKLPIIVGGSGQYLEAVVENYQLTDIKPDNDLREELESLCVEELFTRLEKVNSSFAEKLNNSDKNNKRRLIRYIEVMSKPIVIASEAKQSSDLNARGEIASRGARNDKYEFLLLGLTWSKEVLAERIHKRLIERLENENMIQEASDLHDKTGLSWERLEEFGLEYKYISQYLEEKFDYDQMVELIDKASIQFAKKQMTWFRRWEKKRPINWLNDNKTVEKKVANFLNK
jgi:tRNA dimethylallyltransferase